MWTDFDDCLRVQGTINNMRSRCHLSGFYVGDT